MKEMTPRIAAHPTLYQSTLFRSRLEARWAAFFDLVKYKWQYEPIDFPDWVPDFLVEFPCTHSECQGAWPADPARPGSHRFYAEVKPYYSLEEFEKHPVSQNNYGQKYGLDGGMYLGIDPTIASAEFSHGAGGGVYCGYDLFGWVIYDDCAALWQRAGNITRWKPPTHHKPCLMPGCSESAIDSFTSYCERHLPSL
jgi:hypothetical protein